MRYREFAPHPQLAPYVRLIWTLEFEDPAAFGAPERILPDAVVEVIFHWASPFVMRFGGGDFACQPRGFAVAQMRRFIEIAPTGRSGFVSVRFFPWGAYHFLSHPVASFADSMVPTGDLWGRAAVELEERLGEAETQAARLDLVERFLLAQLRRHHKRGADDFVRAAWRPHGRTSVAALCRELGVSERRLERTFGSTIGLSPKRVLRLSRFLRACSVLRRTPSASLTRVSHACGYYDQSHFIGEFKAFAGMTPREFVAAPSVAFLDVDDDR